MCPATAKLLIDQVLPRIRSAVPRCVKTVGCEDVDELIQDTVTSAAQMLEACEVNGKPIYPASVAFYAIQRGKSGRRSYGATRTDVLCASAQLDGNVACESMDEGIRNDDGDGGMLSLHDLLASNTEDPAQQAVRQLDWAEVLSDLDCRKLEILRAVAEGGTLNKLARKFGVSNPRITQLKCELARQIKQRLGDDVLADVARRPRWASSVYAQQEADACRHARAKANEW